MDLPFLKNKALALELEEEASHEQHPAPTSSVLTPTGSRLEGSSSLFRALNENSESRNTYNFQVEELVSRFLDLDKNQLARSIL